MKPLVARWNRYLTYFILAVLPLERIPSLDLTHPLHATIRLSQVAGAILILINLPLLWKKRGQWLKSPWSYAGLFLIVAFLSTLFASGHLRSASVWIFTTFVVLLAWTLSLTFEKEKLRVYRNIIIGSAMAACLFGLYQFFGDLLSLSTAWTGLRGEYTSAVFGFPRIQSTALEPLFFDDYLLIPLGLLLAMLVERVNWRRILAYVFITTILFANVSRGAAVALVVIAGITVVWASWKRLMISSGVIILATVASALLAVGLIAFGTHIATTRTNKTSSAVSNFSHQAVNLSSGESSVGRTITRTLALKALAHKPALGLGPGGFGVYAHQQMPEKFGDNTAVVDNEPLEILAETGILGALAFLGFVLSVVLLAWKRLAKQPTTSKIFASGLILVLIAIAIQYQTFSTLYITHIWVVIGLLVGILLSNQKNAISKGRSRKQ